MLSDPYHCCPYKENKMTKVRVFYTILILSALGVIYLYIEHLHSFLLGFGIAALAVGAYYHISFFSTRWPVLSYILIGGGIIVKFMITIFGVVFSMKQGWVTSPLIFIVTYFFFLLFLSFVGFFHKQKQLEEQEVKEGSTSSDEK